MNQPVVPHRGASRFRRSFRRFRHALAGDIRLQVRHQFYTAYALVSTVYIVLLHQLPAGYRATANLLLTFSDPSMLGFFFIGGLVLLEKGQDIHEALFATPHSPFAYIGSKLLSLMLLSLGSSLLIHVSTFGFHRGLGWFLIGVALTSAFFTLAGLGLAARCRTMNGFFFCSVPLCVFFTLPAGEVLGLYEGGLLRALPAAGSLLMLQSAFRPVPDGELLLGAACLMVWIGAAYAWAFRSLQLFRHRY
ncbi:MAG: ABC transporter permease [Paenibacillus dendritiformis]|uniref:fluoroquinolone export ABC transporter permease subunit n=1 Tax=uncultured Paenibacillus sp. TaxID=227322 RepID=UPI0025E233A3|nr:ABC transporter permease [uncultured Paenibacillus sp.]MDU5144180.1 ABC transporter permease [Paenibacillus dendritiformis]